MNQKTGHGGTRIGAGRKELLDLFSRLHIGARAENFAHKIADRKALRSFHNNPHHQRIAEAQRWAREGLWQFGSGWWEQSEGAEEIREDIRFSLASMSGDPECKIPPRGFAVPRPRYGQKKHVLATVARWASWYYGTPIKPRYVRDCWSDYIKFQSET